MIARLLLSLLVGCPATSTTTGKVTRFGYASDKWTGGESPCLGRRVEPSDWLVAHRTLPCGTLVRITNRRTGRVVVAPVQERGPYGSVQPDGTWAVKRRKSDPGVWRGLIDATPPVFEALGAKSFDRVTLEAL